MAVCVVSSCSMDDEDASDGVNNNSLGGLYTNPDGSMTYYADFLIDVSGLKPLVNKLDFISQQEDTIKEFPTGETFFTGVKNCIFLSKSHGQRNLSMSSKGLQRVRHD